MKPNPAYFKSRIVKTGRVKRIIELAAEAYGLAPIDISANTRCQPIAEARQMSMACIREVETSATLYWIASIFGCDHKNVIHACQSIKRKREVYPEVEGIFQSVVKLARQS